MLNNTYAILYDILSFVEKLAPVVFSLAVLFFFWGIFKYIRSAGEGKEEGKKIMIWGVVALFVMSSVWGLVKFLGDSFGINPTDAPKVPTISK